MATFTIDTDNLSSDTVVIEINGKAQLFSSDFNTRQQQLRSLRDNAIATGTPFTVGRKLYPQSAVGDDFPKASDTASSGADQLQEPLGDPRGETVGSPRSIFDPSTPGVENREPFAVREAIEGRNIAPVPVPFPEAGSPRFRSAQSRRNMLDIERRAFESAVMRTGTPIEDFLEQERTATAIGEPRTLRARLKPTRIR